MAASENLSDIFTSPMAVDDEINGLNRSFHDELQIEGMCKL